MEAVTGGITTVFAGLGGCITTFVPGGGFIINAIGCFITSVIFLWTRTWAIVNGITNQLKEWSLPIYNFVQTTGAYYNYIIEEVRVRTEGFPWWIRILLYFAWKALLIGRAAIRAFAYFIPYFITLVALTCIWRLFLYTYVMGLEENPGIYNETLALVWEGAKGLVNFFISVWNTFAFIVNLMLPLYYQFVSRYYMLGNILYEFICDILGIGTPFDSGFTTISRLATDISRIGEFADLPPVELPRFLTESSEDDMETLRRHLEDNLFFSTNSKDNNMLLAVGRGFRLVFATFVEVLFAVLEVYYTFTLIKLEFYLKLVGGAFDIVRFFTAVGNAACFGWNVGCGILEVLSLIFDQLFEQTGVNKILRDLGVPNGLVLSPCTDAELQASNTPCECSKYEGGMFSGRSPCPKDNYICVISKNNADSGKIRGDELTFTEYMEKGKARVKRTGPNTDKSLGCPHKFPSPPRNLQGRHLSAFGELIHPPCYSTCVEHQEDGLHWMFLQCGQTSIYLGPCDSHEKTPLRGRTLLSEEVRGRQLQKYNQYIPSDKVKMKEGYVIEGKEKYPIPLEYLFSTDPLPSHQPPKKGYIDFEAFQSILLKAEALRILPNKLGLKCDDQDLLTTQPSFHQTLYRLTCIIAKVFYTEKKPFTGSFLGEENRHLEGVEFTPWDRQKNVKWNKGGLSEPATPVASHPSVFAYFKPFTNIPNLYADPSLGPAQKIEAFHEHLIEVHHKFFLHGGRHKLSMVGRHRGLMKKVALNVTNAIFDALNEGGREIHLQRLEEAHGELKRRGLLTATGSDWNPGDPANLQMCGRKGHICPDGTCAKDNKLENCKWPDSYDALTVIRTVPFAVIIAAKSFNPRAFLQLTFDCWRKITADPSLDPSIALTNVNYIWAKDQVPPNVLYCFPMFPPLPMVPLITWDYKTFIANNCGGEFVNDHLFQRCNCPQYYTGQITEERLQQWLPGVPFSVFARLFNTMKAFQFLWTRVSPGWFAGIWQLLIGLFCNSSTCPELYYLFNATYADNNMSFGSNIFCIFMHAGSISFTVLFFLYPLFIFYMVAGELLWEIYSIIAEIVMILTSLCCQRIGAARRSRMTKRERIRIKNQLEHPEQRPPQRVQPAMPRIKASIQGALTSIANRMRRRRVDRESELTTPLV